MELENKDICKKCGGLCCKKCGCDYYPSDFKDMSFNSLYNKLQEGNISIVSSLEFEELKNGKLFANPHLYLRARNINREIVDLFSLKTTCSLLTNNGCTYDIKERPSGGINLVPKENNGCYPLENPFEKMYEWERYQKVLQKLVKRINGINVYDQIKIDVEKLFEDVLNEKFEGVSEIEIADVLSMITYLVQSFPEEYKEAKTKTSCKVKTLYLK